MCDLGYDEVTEVMVDSWIKAAKAHPCMACKESIPVGIVYHESKRLADGDWHRWKHCVRCWRMCEALWQRNGGECIDMGLKCGEVWEQPPDEIAELAFALPGDLQERPVSERDCELKRMRRLRAWRRSRAKEMEAAG